MGTRGVPDSQAHYNCTLNGYKLFGDSLSKDTDPLSLSPTDRLPFTDSSTNTRHFKIDFSGGNIFNYAIDASWEYPSGSPPFTIDDYSQSANRPRAWACSVLEEENTLYNNGTSSGGSLKLAVFIRDHFNAAINAIRIESPGNFDPVMSTTSTGGGDGFATYELTIDNATPKQGSIDLLISAESEVTGYSDLLPGKHVSAYFTHTATVVKNAGDAPPHAMLQATTPTSIKAGESVSFDASGSTGQPYPTFDYDFDGDGAYGDSYSGSSDKPTRIFDKGGTFYVTVRATNVYGSDISDPVAVTVLGSPPPPPPSDVYVDADYQGNDSDGTKAKPFKTVEEGMSAFAYVEYTHTVHVDYADQAGHYNVPKNGIGVRSYVTLIGDNWNGGGPGKPILMNTEEAEIINAGGSDTYTFQDFTLDGFVLYGSVSAIEIGEASNITIRHCRIIGGGKFSDIPFYTAESRGYFSWGRQFHDNRGLRDWTDEMGLHRSSPPPASLRHCLPASK